MLERVFKQRLSGDSDLHMARESIGLGRDTIIYKYMVWGRER